MAAEAGGTPQAVAPGGTSAPAAPEPEVEETPAAPAPKFELDALGELFGDDAPAWVKEVAAVDTPPPTMADIERLPADAKVVIGKLRARGETAAQQAAEAAQALRQKEAELTARERLIGRQLADRYKFVKDQDFRAKLAATDPGDAPADPYSPEGIQWAARKAAHEQVQTLIDALVQAEQRGAAEVQAAEAAAAAEAAREADDAYILEHYDSFTDPDVKATTGHLMQRYKMPLQEAHETALDRVAAARARTPTPVQAARILAKERLAAGGRAPSGAAALPKEPTADELARFVSENPDQARSALEEMARAVSFTRR